MAVFTSVQDPANPDVIHLILVFIVLFQLAGTAIAYTEYKGVHGDVPGAFVIAWGLFGISVQQSSPAISWTAFALSIVILIYAFKPVAVKRYRSEPGETQPLLHEQP
ncbi:hypothetical protein HK102_013765 [Quaeritorhiza haematococci]|nr:hypothetical protein HK102_013765 [Quaeritorhiza haematococci]